MSSGNNSSANNLLELLTQTTNHEPAATGDEQGEAECNETQRDDTQEELDSKFCSVYPWDSSDSEASVSSEVESVSESQHHADESADNVAESVHLCETSISESGTDSTASEDDEATDNERTTLKGCGQARSGGHGRGSGGRG